MLRKRSHSQNTTHYDLIYIKCLDKANLQKQKVNEWLPGMGIKKESDYKCAEGSSWGAGNDLQLHSAVSSTALYIYENSLSDLLPQSVRAAITESYKLSGLQVTEIFLLQLWEVQNQGASRFSVCWEPLPSSQTSVLLLCPHLVPEG